MPEEFSRTTARKAVRLPSGAIVNVPVITKLSVIDANDRFQETQFSVDNSAQSSRIVHVDTIYASTPDGQKDTSASLQVERIDNWPVLDASDRAQETQVSLDNITGADSTPPHFSTHQRTHVVKYFGTGADSDVWIESELIDEIRVLDGSDRYQESWLILNNPATDAQAQADPADPDISDTANGVDPPVRTDPFQNLINFRDRNTTAFNPPDAISIAFAAGGSQGTDFRNYALMYAASAGIGGSAATFHFPVGDLPTTNPWTTGHDPSTIELTSGDTTKIGTGFSFWGRQNGMPADQPVGSSSDLIINVPPLTISGMTITGTDSHGASYTFDYSGVEFVPYQKPPGTGQAGNFLDYYPIVTTGQTGWKYIPDGTFFMDDVGRIWLNWKPVAT